MRAACYVLRFAILLALSSAVPAGGDETVTLAKQVFAPASPAAEFSSFLTDARQLAASTTPAWTGAEGDLSAWGPALIMTLLEAGASTQTVAGLGVPLE